MNDYVALPTAVERRVNRCGERQKLKSLHFIDWFSWGAVALVTTVDLCGVTRC